MVIKASASITVSFMVDIEAVYRYYVLLPSTSSIPTINPNSSIPSGWTDVEPTYQEGSTNTLYFTDKTVFTNNTWVYSKVSKSSSYEAAKSAYNKAVQANSTASSAASTANEAARIANSALNEINNLEIGGRNLVSNLESNWAQGNWSIPSVGEESILQNSTTRISLKEAIEVEPNTNYWVKVYSSKAVALFRQLDSDGKYISSVIGMTNQKWTAPSNCHFIKITVYENSVISDIGDGTTRLKLEKGTKATDWTPAPEDTDTYIDNLALDLQEQIDNKIQTYNQTADPSTGWTATEKAQHTGDLWYNNSTKETKRWSGSSWLKLESAEAQEATALASSKAQIFTAQPTPPYYIGDMWITSLDGKGVIKTCKKNSQNNTYNSGDWVEGLKYTDDTKIDNLKIGGRNLVLDSDEPNREKAPDTYPCAQYDLVSVVTDVEVSPHAEGDEVTLIEKAFTCLQVGETYTYSIDIEPVNVAKLILCLGNKSQGAGGWIDIDSSKNRQIISHTFTATQENIDSLNEVSNRVFVYCRDAANVANSVFERGTATCIVNSIKLEKGTRATDWTPAPEDMINQINLNTKELLTIEEFEDYTLTTIKEEDIQKQIQDTLQGYLKDKSDNGKTSFTLNNKGILLTTTKENENDTKFQINMTGDGIYFGVKSANSDVGPENCVAYIDKQSLVINQNVNFDKTSIGPSEEWVIDEYKVNGNSHLMIKYNK